MTTRHDTLLRDQHRRYVEEEAEHAAEMMQQGERPGAATGSIAAVPDVEYLPYGPQESVECEIVGSYGANAIEAEYAALRRTAGIMDCPNRATLRITGTERRDFLNRMVTAELKDMDAGHVRPAFWLNRKGRIDADLLLIELGDSMLVDVDVHQAEHTVTTLSDFVFAEDVAIANVTDELYRLCIHGRRALEVIVAASERNDVSLENHQAGTVQIAGHDVSVARHDQVGDVGLHLFIIREQAPIIWERLLQTDQQLCDGKRRIRPVGWYAFNIARIEAGTPIFNVDFGPTNLPHESGLLHERVSFTKGCYLGQEVVARMENLGKPKQMLIGLKLPSEQLPASGAQVIEPQEGEMGDPVGVVTSSTISPMLGAAPIAFAMVKSKHAMPGQSLRVYGEGEPVEATVRGLRFWPEASLHEPGRKVGE